MNNGNVDNLNFNVILNDEEFNRRVKQDIELAKKYNVTVSELLQAKKNIAGYTANEARQVRVQQQNEESLERIRRQSLLNEQKLATEKARTAKETARAATATERLKNKQEQLNNAIKKTSSAYESHNRLLSQAKNLAISYFSIRAAADFIKNLVRVRGEFELQQVALRAIMQDAQAADKVFGQLKNLAIESPFTFQELAKSAKMLSAYNIANEELFQTTKQIADLSAGVGVEMERLILAYGQVRSAEFLRGQEVRQFSEAGINLVGELAKKFSELKGTVVSAGEVFDMISNRMVTFADVQEVVNNLTSEGGRFFDMQRIQANTMYGMVEKLADAWAQALDSMGKSNESTLKGGIQLLLDLVNNWEKVAKALKAVIVALGTYKATMVILRRINDINVLIESYHQMRAAINAASKAQAAFNLLLNKNAFVLIASAIATVAAAIALFASKSKKAADDLNVLNDLTAKFGDTPAQFDEMISSYSKLSTKTNRTEAETQRLNSTIKSLATSVPSAVTAFDDLGNVLGLDMEKLKEYSEQLKDIEKQHLETSIAKNTRHLNLAIYKRGQHQKVIREGINVRGVNGKITHRDLTQEEINKRQDKIDELNEEILQYSSAIASAQSRLSEINRKIAAAIGETEMSQINLRIDNSGLNERQKGVIRLTDATKSYGEIIESLKGKIEDTQKAIAEAEQKINSGTFTGQPLANIQNSLKIKKEDLEALKEAARILGTFSTFFNTGTGKGNPRLEELEKEIKKIEEARKVYLDFQKKVGSERAQKETMTLFGFSVDDASYDKLRKDIIAKAESLGKDGITILRKYSKEIINEGIDAVNNLMSAMDAEVKKYESNYNFFEQLLGLGVNQEQAIEVAFGQKIDDIENVIEKKVSTLQDKLRLLDIDIALNASSPQSLKDQLSASYNLIPDNIKREIEETDNLITDSFRHIIAEGYKLVNEQKAPADKIKDIWDEANREIEKIKLTPLDPVEQERIIEAITSNAESAVAMLASESLKLSDFYQRLFGDLEKYATSSLRHIAEYSQDVLDSAIFSEGGKSVTLSIANDDGELQQVTVTLETYLSMLKQVAEVNEQIGSRNPFKKVASINRPDSAENKRIEQAQDRLNKYNEKYASILEEINRKKKKGLSLTEQESKISKTQQALVSGVADAEKDKLTGTTSSFSEGMAKAGEAVGALSGIFETLGVNMDGTFGAVMEGTQEVISGLASMDVTKPFSIITGSIQAIGGVFTAIFGSKQKRIEKELKNSEARVQSLKNAYKDLERAVDKALGEERYQHTGEQIQNLKQQQAELQNQIELERQKKKSDPEKIRELEQSYKDLQNQIEDTVLNIRDDVIGTVADIATTLADALYEAFKNGENYAEAWKEKVNELVDEIILKMITQKFLEKGISDLLDQYQKVWFDANNNLNMDAVINTMDEFAEELKKIGVDFSQIFEQLKDKLPSVSEGENLNSLQEGIKGVSEQTADLLASYINAMRQEQAVQGVDQRVIKEILASYGEYYVQGLASLKTIEANTAAIMQSSRDIYNLLVDATSASGVVAFSIR